MKKVLLYITLFATLSLASCNDWLDVKPETQTDEKEMFEIARGIEMRRRFNQNIRPIINVLIDNGNLSGDKDNDTISLYRKDTDEPILVKTDHLIQALMDEPKNSLFSELMEGYLFREPEK